MVSLDQMTSIQRKLRTDHGLDDLQSDLRDEAKRFKSFYIKETDPSALYDNRVMFGPAGITATKTAERRSEKLAPTEMTEEGQQRTGTNRDLFTYFGTNLAANNDQPGLSSLTKLLKTSHTHGANLEKLAKDEQKKQQAQKAQERAKKLFASGGFHAGYKRCSKDVGTLPTQRFHRTLSKMSAAGR